MFYVEVNATSENVGPFKTYRAALSWNNTNLKGAGIIHQCETLIEPAYWLSKNSIAQKEPMPHASSGSRTSTKD